MRQEFLLGCNYWASNSGIYMWRNYDECVVEKDLRFLSSYGVDTIRIFPLWPDFQPLNKLIFCNERAAKCFSFGMRTGDEPLLYQKYPDSGLDEKQVKNMRHLLSVAKGCGMKVIVSIITGWMSGRKLVPTPFESRDLIKDSEVVLYECAFIKDLISAIKDFDNIIAYEPGNETNCLSYEVDEFEAALWAKNITDTIRLADSTRPVYAGMHEPNCKGRWSLPVQGRIFDMVTTHPYPIYTPYCGQEKLTSMRASMHAAVENTYYASIARKPSMVQEIGSMGPMFLNDDLTAEYAQTAMLTSYMTGSEGFLWWCAFDQDHLNFAPYDLLDVEVLLGMGTVDYKPKPVLQKFKEMREVLQEIGPLPSAQVDAVCIITNPVDHWGVAYGAFMLGVQSGRYLDFCYEDQPLKDAEYYIMPSITGEHSLPKYQWERLEEKIKNGAKLLITCDGGVFRNFERLTGLRIEGKENIENTVDFTIEGKTLSLNRKWKTFLKSETAQILLRDSDGQILLAQNSFGKGSVMFLNSSLETEYSQAYYPEKTNLYEIYNLFFQNKAKIFEVKDPYVFITTHWLDDGTVGVMIYNFNEGSNQFSFKLDGDCEIEKVLYGEVKGNILTMKTKYAYLEIKKVEEK